MPDPKNAAGISLFTGARQVKDELNARLNEISDALRGSSTISVAGSGDQTLLVTDASPEARKPVLVFTGALTGARNILIPTNEALRIFIVVNNTTGAHALTVKTTAVGSVGVVVAQGKRALIFHDGTDVLDITQTGVVVPRAHAFHNAAQPLSSSGVEGVLSLNSEQYDTDTIHDNSTNNSRLTCKTAGDYDIKGGAGFAANVTGLRYIAIKINGVAKQYVVVNAANSVSLGSALVVVYTATLAVNDYVELWAYQDSGGSLNVTSCYLAMEKIG